ncbi:MAG: TRAP transporter small permease subunit [Promethearchaeota archaeon]
MKRFEKMMRSITDKAAYGGMVAVVACVGLVVADIVKRSIGFGLIPGVIEVVEFISALILSLGIGYLTFVKGHVAVGILVDRFRPRTQAVFDIINYTISFVITGLLTWAMFTFARYTQRAGYITSVLTIPFHPFVYIVAGSLALTCVVLAKDLAKSVITVIKGREVT